MLIEHESEPLGTVQSSMCQFTQCLHMQGGLALAREVYSPHLDMHQRLTILDALSTAARQLSQGLPAPACTGLDAPPQPEGEAGSAAAGQSRRWGVRSLAKQREGPPSSRRNR